MLEQIIYGRWRVHFQQFRCFRDYQDAFVDLNCQLIRAVAAKVEYSEPVRHTALASFICAHARMRHGETSCGRHGRNCTCSLQDSSALHNSTLLSGWK